MRPTGLSYTYIYIFNKVIDFSSSMRMLSPLCAQIQSVSNQMVLLFRSLLRVRHAVLYNLIRACNTFGQLRVSV